MNFVELQKSDGESIKVRFREFEMSDSESIVNCIRNEYGDSYRKRKMYDPNYIVEQVKNQNMHFYIAELENREVIGCLALAKAYPTDIALGIATGIVLEPYRQFGVFWNLTKFIATDIRKIKNISAVYCHSMLYHKITQHVMEKIGLKPTGFIFSIILAQTFQHSYSKDQNLKISLGTATRKISKNDVGTLYIPEMLVEFAQDIYHKLHTHFEISTSIEKLSGVSEIEFLNDPRQQNCTIRIHSAGSDLKSKIQSIQSEFQDEFQTFNIFLNISDSRAIAAYEILEDLGYFCSGFNPLCSDKEIMILHNPRNIEINFDELKLTEQFGELRAKVRKFYESRKEMQ